MVEEADLDRTLCCVAEGEVQIHGLQGHQVVDAEGVVTLKEGGREGGREGGKRFHPFGRSAPAIEEEESLPISPEKEED